MAEPKKLKVGVDSVVMGNVSGEVGDRSVVIGATDANGNVNLTTPMTVGHGAVGDPTSIVIGAGARSGAGNQLVVQINRLSDLVKRTNDDQIIEKFNVLIEELESRSPNKERSMSILTWLKGTMVSHGVALVIDQIKERLDVLLPGSS